MSDNPLSAGNTASIVERAKGIILKPAEEWPKIAGETDSVKDVFLKYVVPLAAIPAVCSLIGGQVFGYGGGFFHYRPSLTSSITMAITSYVLSLVGLFVVAFIANFLAPKFSGQDNFEKAFKLCAYSFTAAWVVGVFQLVPMLGILGLLGLYSLYLFYTGVTPMMAVPTDKALGYTAVTVVVAIVVQIVFGAIAASLTGGFAAANLAANSGAGDDVTVSIPGMGEMKSTDGKSTIEMPGLGTIHVDEKTGTTTIQGQVDGKDFSAQVNTQE